MYVQTDTLSCFLCKHTHILNWMPANTVHVVHSVATFLGWRLSVAAAISSHQSNIQMSS